MSLLKIALLQIKDSCEQLWFYENVARALYAQEKFMEASVYFKMVADITAKCRYPHTYAIVQEHISNTGLCYANAGVFDSAYYYYGAAMNYIEKNQADFGFTAEHHNAVLLMKAVINGNLGDLLFREGRYQEAEEYLLKSLDVTSEKDSVFANGSRVLLLKIYVQNKQMRKAAELIRKLENTVDMNTITKLHVDLSITRARYFRMEGELSSVYDNLYSRFLSEILC